MNEQLPVPRQTISQMVTTYTAALEQLRQACDTITQAQASLQRAFDEGGTPSSFSNFSLPHLIAHHHADLERFSEIELAMRQEAWRTIVQRIELRKLCSMARAKEIDEQLKDGNRRNLPDITEGNILAMLENNAKSASDYLREAVVEVFNQLRPRHSEYKTNQPWRVGSKVILSFGCERSISGGKYRVAYWKQDFIRAIDNVFHLLDGAGVQRQSHYGELSDAIAAAPDGCGETAYFRFRCFKNQNLHLEFKRQDLVDRLNLMAGCPTQLPGACAA